MLSAKWWPICLGLHVLRQLWPTQMIHLFLQSTFFFFFFFFFCSQLITEIKLYQWKQSVFFKIISRIFSSIISCTFQVLLSSIFQVHYLYQQHFAVHFELKILLTMTNIVNHIGPSSAGPIYKQDTNMVIKMPADALAPSGARSSPDTVLTTNLRHVLFDIICWPPQFLLAIQSPDDLKRPTTLQKSCNISSVDIFANQWWPSSLMHWWYPDTGIRTAGEETESPAFLCPNIIPNTNTNPDTSPEPWCPWSGKPALWSPPPDVSGPFLRLWKWRQN